MAKAQPAASPRARHRSKEVGHGLWILLAVLVAAGAVYLAVSGTGGLAALGDPALLWAKLGKPLIKSLTIICGGLLLGQILEGLGWMSKLGALAWPVIRLAHLPKEAGAAFSMAFVSGVTANTLLYTSWQEGRLDSRQLVAANVLTASLPAYFLHLPTTFFVVYALLGPPTLVYFGLTLAAALLRTVAVVVVSRLALPAAAPSPGPALGKKPSWSQVWRDAWPKFTKRLKRLLIIILPIYLLVFLLAQAGFFGWLTQAAARWVAVPALPVEAMSVVVFAIAAEFTSGFAAAGALLGSGALGVKAVVLALLIGNMVATPVRALRHQLPHYLGIYSPGLGARLLAIGQTARVASVLLVTVVYGVWG